MPMSDHQPRRRNQLGANLPRLVQIMQRLLEPGGCPWDQAQTHASLRRYVMEEACEVIDAIDNGGPDDLREELGDLLLQVVFHATLAQRDGVFGPDDVIDGICNKLERRHPHVFGSVKVDEVEQVHRNWERIKSDEKKDRGWLDGVSLNLPALAQAQQLGEKAAWVGFDWSDRTSCRSKLDEEVAELDKAIESGNPKAIEEELGDALFALVNLARHVDVNAELALRATSEKFKRRFAHVERKVRASHGGFDVDNPVSMETFDKYWCEAKRAEASQLNATGEKKEDK